MFGVIDVYNRGGAYSLGTILQLSKQILSHSAIEKVAIKRAGGPDSGGYIPCVCVKLVDATNGTFKVGTIINPDHIVEIWGSQSSVNSIADVPMRDIKSQCIPVNITFESRVEPADDY